ncbi:MAG: hypothetical protein ACQEQV_08135 [Fibrobacterota bacterium]
MRVSWNFEADDMDHYITFFEERIEKEPAALLKEIDDELEALYIRMDNDQTGRGVIGDATQEKEIAALQTVRAKCLRNLRNE